MVGTQKISALGADKFGAIGKAQPPVRRQRCRGVIVRRIGSRDFLFILGIAPEELPGEFGRIQTVQISIVRRVAPVRFRHHADFLPDSTRWFAGRWKIALKLKLG